MSKPRSLHDLLSKGKDPPPPLDPIPQTIEEDYVPNPVPLVLNNKVLSVEEELEPEMPSISKVIYDETEAFNEIFNTPIINITTPTAINTSDQHLYDKIERLEAEKYQLEMELRNVMQMKNSSNDVINQELERTIENLKYSLQEANEKTMIEIDKNEKLQRETVHLMTMKSDFDHVLIQKENMERNIDQSNDEMLNIRSELKETKIELNKLKMELVRTEKERDSLQNENNILQEELSRLTRENMNQQGNLDLKLREANNARQVAEDQVNVLRAEINEKLQLHTRMSNDLMNFERHINQLTTDNTLLQQKVNQMDGVERELAQTKWKLMELEKECQNKDRFNENLQHQINQSNYQNQQNNMSTYQNPPIPSSNYYSNPPLNTQMNSTQQYKPPPPPVKTSSFSQIPSNNTPEYNSFPQKHTANNRSLGSIVGKNDQMSVDNLGFGSNPGKPRNSLASVLNMRGVTNTTDIRSGQMSQSPFATEMSSAQIMGEYEVLDRKLTALMTEKSNLQQEQEKLHQRGLRTLKERSRMPQIEMRLGELSSEISSVRKSLSSKPS